MECLSRALKIGVDARGQINLLFRLFDGLNGVAKRNTGGKIERQCDDRKLALMIDRERRGGRLEMREGAERYLRSVRLLHVNMFERIRAALILRVDLENHVVLVQLREDGRYLPLAECVVESVVDRLWRNSQARRGVAIDI